MACAAIMCFAARCAPGAVPPTSTHDISPPATRRLPTNTVRPQPSLTTSPVPATPSTEASARETPSDLEGQTGLSQHAVAALRSLRLIDDHPLYTMRSAGAHDLERVLAEAANDTAAAALPWPGSAPGAAPEAWACSLFAAAGGESGLVYGRNFDWEPSPALLLFSSPPDGYASVSMVDIGYLIGDLDASNLTDLRLDDLSPLLEAPYWPFDGMNEHGLVIGMAAVPFSPLPHHPAKQSADSLMVIRLMLDRASDVEEAVEVLGSYNVRWGGGPPLHYLIADSSGQAALVEYVDGEVVVLRSSGRSHLATNHLRATADLDGGSGCWRYELMAAELAQSGGILNVDRALDLLNRVSQPNTQWSVIYSAEGLRVDVVTARRYDSVHTFGLQAGAPVDAEVED